jgi:hypothetical protein
VPKFKAAKSRVKVSINIMTLCIPASISGFILSQNLNKKTQNLNDSFAAHDMIAYKPELISGP